jgi:hypothetical protein
MPTTVRNTDILFNDSSVQSTAAGALTIKATSSYTSSGTSTWTKASGATGDTVVAVVIGGGGSGAKSTITSTTDKFGTTYSAAAVSGGGGGGVCVIAMPYEDCPSSVTVIVGAGGAAVSTSNQGNNGADSKFGNFAIATGGKGGNRQTVTWGSFLMRGGLGGSPLPGNNSNNSDSPGQEYSGSSIVDAGYRNGGSARSIAYATGGGFTPSSYASLIPWGYTGGGGGLAFGSGASATNLYTQNATGGVGRIFGDGGAAGSTTTASGTAGSAPGGGGGAAIGTGNSGAGGTGTVYVYVVAGFVPASSILDRGASNKYTVAL